MFLSRLFPWLGFVLFGVLTAMYVVFLSPLFPCLGFVLFVLFGELTAMYVVFLSRLFPCLGFALFGEMSVINVVFPSLFLLSYLLHDAKLAPKVGQ